MPADQLSVVVDLAAKILSSFVALVAVIAAIGQLTSVARLRKRESWATTAAQQEPSNTRQAALRGIAINARARLVAQTYVPSYLFLPAVVFSILPPASLFLPLYSGTTLRAAIWHSLVAFLGTMGVVSFIFGPLVKRRLIIEQYRRGISLNLNAFSTSSRKEHLGELALSALFAASLSGATAGAAFALSGNMPPVSLALFVAGGLWTMSACVRIYQYAGDIAVVRVVGSRGDDVQPGLVAEPEQR